MPTTRCRITFHVRRQSPSKAFLTPLRRHYLEKLSLSIDDLLSAHTPRKSPHVCQACSPPQTTDSSCIRLRSTRKYPLQHFLNSRFCARVASTHVAQVRSHKRLVMPPQTLPTGNCSHGGLLSSLPYMPCVTISFHSFPLWRVTCLLSGATSDTAGDGLPNLNEQATE